MENPKLNYIFICEYAFFADGNKPSFVGIHSQIRVHRLPFKKGSFYIVANILVPKSSKNHYRIGVKIVNAETEQILHEKLNFNVETESDDKVFSEIGIMNQINGLEFKEEGTYKVQIFLDDILIGDRDLVVDIIK